MISFFSDAMRYGYGDSFLSLIKCCISTPGARFMLLYRLSNSFKFFHPVGFFSRLWYKRLQVKYGYQIPYSCTIGAGFFLGHYGNIVINSKVKIGENCNVAQGVTIGQVNRGKLKGVPKIGNKVWIGANSVIVGNITIGNGVLIAPLSFVNTDIPDNAVVVGNPAKIISYNGSAGYINNTMEEEF